MRGAVGNQGAGCPVGFVAILALSRRRDVNERTTGASRASVDWRPEPADG